MSHFPRLVGAAVAAAGVSASFGCLPSPDSSNPEPPKKTEFAEDAVQRVFAPADVKFDSERALKYLKQLCDIGPRISGSEEMKTQQELIEKHFKDLGATVTRQEFKARQVSRRTDTAMANIIVSWHPDKERRVLICAHYDTRPIADQEENRQNWTKPFVSANDGAGGIALILAGIPCADVIDFDYPHWHKLTDTPDKVSGDQLSEVAKVLATWWTTLK